MDWQVHGTEEDILDYLIEEGGQQDDRGQEEDHQAYVVDLGDSPRAHQSGAGRGDLVTAAAKR